MINKLFKEIKERKNLQDHRESGAAMILAIILLLMLVSVSIFVAAAATTQDNVAKNQTVRSALVTSSNNGIEWAMSIISSGQTRGGVPIIDGMPETNPWKGSLTSINSVRNTQWVVWSERVVTGDNKLSYYIYSKAYSTEIGEEKYVLQRALVESTTVSSVTTEKAADGTPVMTYKLDNVGAISQGIFSNTQMAVNGNAKVYAQNSLSEGPYPSGTKKSTVSTNGFVQIANTTSGIERIIGGLEEKSVGCAPSNVCTASGSPDVSYRGTNLGFQTTNYKASVCARSSYPNWQSSLNNSSFNFADGKVQCVGDLLIDSNTSVPATFTPNNPLTIVVHGDVKFTNGANLNWGSSPLRLKVIGVGGTLEIPKTGSPNVSMIYASQDSTCNLGGQQGTITTGSLTYFGALACGSINIADGGNRVFVDTGVYSLANDPSAGEKIWFKTRQEELADKS